MISSVVLAEEIKSDERFIGRDPAAWDSEIRRLTVDAKFDEDLAVLVKQYARKVSMIRERLDGDWSVTIHPVREDGKRRTVEEMGRQLVEELGKITDKEGRLMNKLACCLKEQEFRKSGVVVRFPHHTDYYCDYTNGNDTNDGLGTGAGNAWKTLGKYTSVTVRTAGDRLFVRANQTHTYNAADITFDEDGTVDAYISIIGCDATTNDPWADDSDVKPIIDFADAAYQFDVNGDEFWWVERLLIKQSADLAGAFSIQGSRGWHLVDCDFKDSGASSAELLAVFSGAVVWCDGCTFEDGWNIAIAMTQAILHMKDCTIDAGSVRGTIYGLYAIYGGIAYCDSCSFCPTNGFTGGANIYVRWGTAVYLRNCSFGVNSTMLINSYSGGFIYSEDHDGTFESQITFMFEGTIERGTSSPRSGGADSYARMSPNSNCGPGDPLVLGMGMAGFSAIWLGSGVEKTVTVYARVASAWDSALTAAEAYLKASYLSNGASAARTEVTSTQQIANDTTWTAFTVTFTPAREGWVYLWFHLEEFEDATEYVDVDILPVVS